MSFTFLYTLFLPLQTAVLLGVGVSFLLHVINVSNRLEVMRWVRDDQGMYEEEPPSEVGTAEVIVLQPYGQLFFASADVLDEELPAVTKETSNSVVVIRLRGTHTLGSTLVGVIWKQKRMKAYLSRQ